MSDVSTDITEPGVYNLDPVTYHGDPVPGGSLSSGGARKLLSPSCPAKFKWWQENGQDPKAEFDFGHAAHLVVLGAGPEIQVIEADNWKSPAVRAVRDAARAEGRVPILEPQWEVVEAMAAVLREDPIAGPLFEPGTGDAERSIFWQDTEFGVWRRARPDWLPFWRRSDGRIVLPDYKTCTSSDPQELRKAVVQHGYDQQADWYGEAVKALGLADEVEFLLVCQEKTPPYVVTTVEPDIVALKRGRARNRLAMAIYRTCRETGVWPGYTDRIELLPLPYWVENEFDRELEDGVYDVNGEARWVSGKGRHAG